jgi:D-alanyl-D-alanine carboxypeptidase
MRPVPSVVVVPRIGILAMTCAFPIIGLPLDPAFSQTRPNPAEALRILSAAYPQALAAPESNTVVFKDGTRMQFDDGKGEKDFDTLLKTPDIKDMFAIPYPRLWRSAPPALNEDPGRIRNVVFFKKMYGDCDKGEVTHNLVDITWLPKRLGTRLKITKINGVAEQLAAVSRALDELPQHFMPFLSPPAGTYNCRPIAGTQRVSAHGLGIAVDIATRHSHYWRWSKPDADGRLTYKNEIPREIVDIFEKHGFIWGGKWYHYDTMHFEYRPEILAAAP